MRVTHVELPRGFTLTIRPFLTGVATSLAAAGIEFRQRDVNFTFWEWWLGGDRLRDQFQTDALAPDVMMAIVARLHVRADQLDIAELAVGIGGVTPTDPTVARSSRRLLAWLALPPVGALFDSFCAELDRELHFADDTMVSCGVDSAPALAFALALGQYLHRHHPHVHVCVARHNHEDFSLLLTLDRIIESGSMFEAIDSICIHQEHLTRAIRGLIGLVARGDATGLCDVVTKTRNGIIRHPPPSITLHRRPVAVDHPQVVAGLHAYFDAIAVHRHHLVYAFDLVGNRCFWGRCTFCVQIAKHAADDFYDEPAATAAHLQLVRLLVTSIGLRHISFTDEALRPRTLAAIADAFERDPLDLRWCCRLIASTRVDLALVTRMHAVGCRLILFGVETPNPATARRMGKVSHDTSPDELLNFLKAVGSVGIDLVLSYIYWFPTAAADELTELIEFHRAVIKLNPRTRSIFNPFGLYLGSQMAAEPERFDIVEIERPGPDDDLQIRLPYRDATGRGHDDHPTALRLLGERLGLGSDDFAQIIERGEFRDWIDVAHLDYSSFGLTRMAAGAEPYLGAMRRPTLS